MRLLITAAAFLALIGLASAAHADTIINFDDGTAGNTVGAFYAGSGVTFTDAEWVALGGLAGGTPPMAIMHDTFGSQFDSSSPIILTFAPGVSFVSIVALDLGAAGVRMDAYDQAVGGALVDWDDAYGVGLGVGNFELTSTAAADIRRVEIYQADRSLNMGDGIGLDNLYFGAAPVPEPGTLALLGLGLAGLATRRRKKRVA